METKYYELKLTKTHTCRQAGKHARTHPPTHTHTHPTHTHNQTMTLFCSVTRRPKTSDPTGNYTAISKNMIIVGTGTPELVGKQRPRRPVRPPPVFLLAITCLRSYCLRFAAMSTNSLPARSCRLDHLAPPVQHFVCHRP